MVNKLLIFLSMFIMVFAFTFCGEGKEKEKPEEPQPEEMQEPEITEPQKPDFTKTPLEGKVVDFTKLLLEEEADVDAETAMNLARKGHPIAVQSKDGDLYFIYNANGTIASKKLAKHAGKETVKIYGEYKEVKDMKIVKASKIE